MAENDKVQAELPVGGNPFTHQSVRIALQAAIADEIVIDGAGTYSIRVPDKLIARLETILTPYLAPSTHNISGLIRIGDISRRANEAAALEDMAVGIGIEKEGLEVVAYDDCGSEEREIISWPLFESRGDRAVEDAFRLVIDRLARSVAQGG